MAPLSPVRWWICGLLLLATTLNYLDRITLNQLNKELEAAFQFNQEGYSELETAFSLAFGVGTLFFGWLVDRVNVRWVYPLVVLGWSAAGFLTGFASVYSQLLLCRILLGLFEAGNWPCGIRTSRTVLPPEERSFGNALFQSGTAIGAILAPLAILACFSLFEGQPDVWRYPFLVIGGLGFLWIIAWFIFAPRSMFPMPQQVVQPQSFRSVLADRRFWLLIGVIIGVNSAWHTLRVWLPYLLRDGYGFSGREFQKFSMLYYLAADIGTWTVGLITLGLARRGSDLFRVRRGAFIICTVWLVLGSIQLCMKPQVMLLQGLLLLIGFAALGLFPTYFALSQDLSARHQGKVTGTLGFINALWLAGMYKLEGVYANRTQDYAGLILISTVPAILACGLLFLWRDRQSNS